MRLNSAAERSHRRPTASVSNLVYLAAIGVVAAAIAGVFFTAGFLLLAPPAAGTISDLDSGVPELQTGSSASDNRPSPADDGRPAGSKLGAAAIAPPIVAPGGSPALQSVSPLPASSGSDSPVIAAAQTLSDALSPRAELSAKPAVGTSIKSEPALGSPPTITPAPAMPGPHLSAAEITNLLEHGDALLRNADVTSARLFYERAASGGDGRAALRLGATFDPAFLERAGLRNVKGDAAEAHLWYARALDLGTAEVKRKLNGVQINPGR